MISIALSALLAVLDMVGVVAMLPMMQYVTGQPLDEGAMGHVYALLGDPTPRTLVLGLSLLIFGAFVVKDVAALFVRRWQLRFMASQSIRNVDITSAGIPHSSLLVAPAPEHRRQAVDNPGSRVHGLRGGLSAALSALTEILTISFIFASLLVISPKIALAAAAYFGLAAFVVQRVIRPRIQAAGERTRVASQSISKSSLQSLSAVKEIKLRRAHGPFVG